MECDGKGHLRQQENCILRGEKGKFCGTNWTTHHYDAAANWIDGEFSSILRLTYKRSAASARESPEGDRRRLTAATLSWAAASSASTRRDAHSVADRVPPTRRSPTFEWRRSRR